MKSRNQIPPYRKKLGCSIRTRRNIAGVSQEQFAEFTGCHRNYIGLIERGEQNLTLDSLVKVARALRCRLSDLLADAGL